MHMEVEWNVESHYNLEQIFSSLNVHKHKSIKISN